MTITSLLRNSLLAGAALTAACPVAAGVKAGVDAWSRGDYARAIAEWRGDAERGDADAQFDLGQAYKLGRGVPADLAKAEDLFGRAAAQGHLQAADNFGLLLFQRGEHARALPYIKAASDRGDPRAEYLLGLAYFNGDNVDKDWVRAYALVSLAQQGGLAQAVPALAQMDKYIPIEQRQQSVALASQLDSQARATRERQLASADLGVTAADPRFAAPPAAHTPAMASAGSASTTAAHASGNDSPRNAGADYARPHTPEGVTVPRPAPRPPAAMTHPTPAPSPPPPSAHERPAPAAPAASGSWRVQLGAFGVPGNAEALWNRVKARPELAGHGRLLVPAGKVAKLQAGGFASESEAQAACSRLTAAGFACMATRN
jgi:TPR repeat protein